MISIRLILTSPEDRKMVRDSISEFNDYLGHVFVKCSDLDKADILLFSVDCEDDFMRLERIRRDNSQVELMIITDGSIQAERFISPAIRSLSILNKPLEKTILSHSIAEVYHYFLEKKKYEIKYGCFAYGEQTHRYLVPYGRIRFFESRNKKMVLHEEEEEYEFYDSFCKMEQYLPEYFVRCHRSYIVNLSYITSIDLARHYLMLGDTRIPISRKYGGQTEKVYRWMTGRI